MASVTLQGVTKEFTDAQRGCVLAVDKANLTIPDGQFTVFVGPSGCGKTTTLRMVAGLERQTAGDILIGDRIVNKVRPGERDIAMVFQDYALYPHMTVRENLAFGLTNLGRPKTEIEAKIARAAQMLDIGHLLDRRPKELSGGQRQRVAVGRAIVRNPRVFLFDEPLSNLDAKLRVQMRVELAELHQRLQTTVIYVTHDQIEAMTLGQRIVVMDGGKIQQVDTPQNLYQQPRNTFVASFIGNPPMNLWRGRLATVGDGLEVRVEQMLLSIPADRVARYRPHAGQEVIFGLRPEDIHDPALVAGQVRDGVRPTVNVRVIEHLGSEVLLYFGVGAEQGIARVHPESRLGAGKVALEFDLRKMHLFSAQTTEAL